MPADKSASYRRRVREIAVERGLDPDIMERQIGFESNWDPRAVSKSGAKGLGQFIPTTGAQYGLKGGGFFDVEKSLQAHGKYMQYLYRKFGNYPQALVGYHSGPYSSDVKAVAEGRFSDMGPDAQKYIDTIVPDHRASFAKKKVAGMTGGLNTVGPLLYKGDEKSTTDIIKNAIENFLTGYDK